jgi:hypothetical protein
VIVDRRDKLALQVFQNPAELLKVIPRKDPVPVIVLTAVITRVEITSSVLKDGGMMMRVAIPTPYQLRGKLQRESRPKTLGSGSSPE